MKLFICILSHMQG